MIIESGFTTFDANLFVSPSFNVLGVCTIEQLWVNCSTPPLIINQFNNEIIQTTTLYVPMASKDLFYLASGWGEIKRIVGF